MARFFHPDIIIIHNDNIIYHIFNISMYKIFTLYVYRKMNSISWKSVTVVMVGM